MIEFQNVSKTYKTGVTANSNISFDVKKGEVVGIVGPNGSGKTTMIRQLLKILAPSEGTIRVDDRTDYLDLIAYVPQFVVIYPALSVQESLSLTLKYQGVKKAQITEKVDMMLERTGLDQIARQPVYTLSGGQQKLLAFANALIQEKPYLILDEPTSMVDILTKERIWNIVHEIKGQCGILLSSHDMEEVKRFADQVLVLSAGKILFQGSVEEIGDGSCVCTISTDNNAVAMELLQQSSCTCVEQDGDIRITANDIGESVRVIQSIAGQTEIKKLQCEYPAFYEGVLTIVKGN